MPFRFFKNQKTSCKHEGINFYKSREDNKKIFNK